jgi:hypothetical protein
MQGGCANLRWAAHPENDLAMGGLRYQRYVVIITINRIPSMRPSLEGFPMGKTLPPFSPH